MFSLKENFKRSLSQKEATAKKAMIETNFSFPTNTNSESSTSPFSLKKLIYNNQQPSEFSSPDPSRLYPQDQFSKGGFNSAASEDLLSCFKNRRLRAKENLISSQNNNLYSILESEVDATSEEIKKNYRKLCLRFHPDKTASGDQTQFVKINKAYKILSDPELRATYDEYGWEAVQFSVLLREETLNL